MKIDMSEEQLKGIINFNLGANCRIKALEEENERLRAEIIRLKNKTSKQHLDQLEKTIDNAIKVLRNEWDDINYSEWNDEDE